MTEETKAPEKEGVGGTVNDAIMAKLEKLEVSIKEIEQAKKKRILVSRIGILLILAAIGLFAWNMYTLGSDLSKPDNLTALQEQGMEDVKELIELHKEDFQKDFTEVIIPELQKELIARVKKEMPALQDEGEKILQNVQDHIEVSLNEQLESLLADALVELENELQEKYPKIDPEKLHITMDKAKDTFIEEMTNSLEKKMAMLNEDFDDMEKTLDKFSKLSENDELSNMDKKEIKLELIESMLELAIYELNPGKGDVPSTVKGGTK